MGVKQAYNQTEVGITPKDWNISVLKELTKSVISGRSKSGNQIGRYPVYGSTGIIGYTEHPDYEGEAILVARVGANAGKINTVSSKYGVTDNTIIITVKEDNSFSFLAQLLEIKKLNDLVFGSGQPLITGSQLKSLQLATPKLAEQKLINNTLNDVNSLLHILDQIIIKKENVKQATMYQLLSDETCSLKNNSNWKEYYLEDLAVISKGRQLDTNEKILQEDFPHYNGGIYPSSFTNKVNRPPNTIIISEGGNSCGYVQIINEPFWCGGHCYSIKPFSVDNNFLYYALKQRQNKIMKLRVGSGLPNIQKTNLGVFKLKIPEELDYQKKISKILLDMDNELISLKLRRDKTFKLKEAMMYELLTGKTRLAKLDLIHD